MILRILRYINTRCCVLISKGSRRLNFCEINAGHFRSITLGCLVQT